MCGFQPINMAAEVSRIEVEGCTMYIVTVRHHFNTAQLGS